MERKAVIFGIKGTTLTRDERNLLKHTKPWGIILFSRNIKNIFQLKVLANDIKKIFKDPNYPLLIDQEGGRVSRINRIIDLSLFSQEYFGQLYKSDKINFLTRYKIYIDMVSNILKNVGVNINTVPVLDVRRKNSHKIIGDRSFSYKSSIVKKIGKFCIDFYQKNKIATVMKHMPGHGLSKSDSHFEVPVIKNKKKLLMNKDFKPFIGSNSLFAMTAHVIYPAYDSVFTATHSRIIINEVIRKHIGFKGILISDDITMNSLKFGLKDNATKALDAGCNLIMHCNGNIREMFDLTKVIPKIDIFTQKKTSHFYKFLG